MISPVSASAEREQSLLLTLTHKVRFLSAEQVGRAFGTRADTARKWLFRLAAAGLVQRRDLIAHPELTLSEPVFSWRPGDDPPSCGQVSHRCRSRWTEPPRNVSVWVASVRAANLLGGFGGRVLRLDHATHDLHVGGIFCRLLQEQREDAAAWRPEESLVQLPGERMPDALFYDAADTAYRALEFGGACKPARVEKLHAFGERYAIAYELW